MKKKKKQEIVLWNSQSIVYVYKIYVSVGNSGQVSIVK